MLATHDRRLAATLVVAVCLLWGVGAPAVAGEQFVDQILYRETTASMRDGDTYYEAMDEALRAHPATNGPATSTRAFRFPTVFVVWQVLPTQAWVWGLFVVLVAAMAFAVLHLTTWPFVAPLFAAYVLRLARPYSLGAASWLDQYLIVEIWALPLIVASIVAWRRERRWIAAAAFALAAVLVRELVAGLLVGGLLVAWRSRRPVWPWLAAVVAAAAMWIAHDRWAGPYLVSQGHEAELIGSGQPPWTITAMMATGLPAPVIVGPLLWGLTVRRLWRLDRELLGYLSLLLLLPFTGLLVGRNYWGFLVAPLLVWFGVEELVDLVRARRAAPAR